MAHLNINIVELRILFAGTTFYFETTAPPDYVYLKDFQNNRYKERFLKSRGLEFNKKNMSIVRPDLSDKSVNPSAALVMNYGCQMVGMSFQSFDNNMEYYSLFFDRAGSAFALKP